MRASLQVTGLRQRDGATVTFYATRKAASAASKTLGLGADVRPERAHTRLFRFWLLAVAPVGDPGEGRVLPTTEGGFLVRCAVDCVHVHPGLSYCPGHPMTADQSREFAAALHG